MTISNQETFDFLKECGCCDICCLRFLKARGNEYEDVQDSLKKLNIISTQHNESDRCPKKSKANTCTACLGFFSEQFQNEIIEKIANGNEFIEFECNEIVVALTFPIILHIRQFSLWIALLRKFGENISKSKPEDVPLKEAAKLILNPKLCKRLDKTYDQNGVMITINVEHEDEAKEVMKLESLNEQLTNHKLLCKEKFYGTKMTRRYFEKYYTPDSVCLKTYEEHIGIPPDIPNKPLILDSITYTGPTVFLAGRYRKLSRQLSHSPWVLNGKRVLEDSIQELITQSVAPFFGVPQDRMIFSSSGREDVDVRCLGKGRPFVLEIPDSKKVKIPKTKAAHIELEIEKSLRVSVANLQLVERSDLSRIKTGEEDKRKFYRALCVLKEPATPELMEKLNIPDGFQIKQITPIRVLHRRSLHSRERTVYAVQAFADRKNPRAIILDLITQAGTYIKELVHGEFGRTTPNLSSIAEQQIDIIALDVVGIDLDWPKEIDNRDALDCTIVNKNLDT